MSPSGRRPPDDADARIDRLYALPLDQFVQARNALAAELRREDRAVEAARVKALSRPSLPAWALNQVYWHARRDFDRLTAAGDRMRDLQRQALSGRKVTLDEPARERQAAVRAVVDRAAALMSEAGQTVTEATRQRIAASADAIAAYGSRPDEYAPGRLERELEPPGFAALADLAAGSPLRLVKSDRDARPASAAATSSPAPAGEAKEDAKARAAAARAAERERREALKAAKEERDARERDVERARRVESEAATALAEHRRRTDALRRELAGLEDQMQKLEQGADEAKRRVSDAQDARRRAAERVRELER